MSKITAYGSLSSPQSDDVLPVVDVHDTTMAATGTTKKITVGNLVSNARPFILVNGSEGITPSGTAVTTGNSGGTSGNAFDDVSLGTGATIVSDNLSADTGSLCIRMSTPASPSVASAGWSASMPLGGTGAIGYPALNSRLSVYLTAYPVTDLDLIFFWTGSRAFACKLVIRGGAGKIATVDSTDTVIATTATAVPLNQWFRVEFDVTGDPSAGSLTGRLFYYASDAVPVETLHNTGQATGGYLNGVDYGPCVAFGLASVSIRFDNLGVANTGPMGPASSASPGWLPSDNGLQLANYYPGAYIQSGAVGAGKLLLIKLAVRQPRALSKLWFLVSSAGSGPSTGTFAGIYTVAGSTATLAGSTLDCASTFTVGEGRSASLQAVTAVQPPFIYAGLLVNMNSMPQLYYAGGDGVNAAVGPGLTYPVNYPFVVNGTGRTSLPSTLDLTANDPFGGIFTFWCGAS